MNPFSGFPAILSYVLVYGSTSLPSLTLFLFVESPYFSSFRQHVPVVIIANFPHYGELFTFHAAAVYSGSLFAGARAAARWGSVSFWAGSTSGSF